MIILLNIFKGTYTTLNIKTYQDTGRTQIVDSYTAGCSLVISNYKLMSSLSLVIPVAANAIAYATNGFIYFFLNKKCLNIYYLSELSIPIQAQHCNLHPRHDLRAKLPNPIHLHSSDMHPHPIWRRSINYLMHYNE